MSGYLFHKGLKKYGRIVRKHENNRGDHEVEVWDAREHCFGCGGSVAWFGENTRPASHAEVAEATGALAFL